MIKSADLHSGMKLQMKGVDLEVVDIKYDKRRTVAVCKDAKGKRHEHTVSELYYGNAKVLSVNPNKSTAIPKRNKPAAPVIKHSVKKQKDAKPKRTVTLVRRGDGIATIIKDENGNITSSWVRTFRVKVKA